jgi:hypothetical protein
MQVLASIQLDATLASIKQEARHDGVLAERMAHWTAVFRERGEQLQQQELAASPALAGKMCKSHGTVSGMLSQVVEIPSACSCLSAWILFSNQ